MPEIDEKLDLQARACDAMGSPFTAALMRAAAADYRDSLPVRAHLDRLADRARPGLHLAGALHYFALRGEAALARHYPSTGGDGNANAAWLAARPLFENDDEHLQALLKGIPQTNEPARSMPLLAAYARLAQRFGMPLALFEIGSSAGLNLRFDHFAYEGDNWSWGSPASPLTLRNRTESGAPQTLPPRINVIERRGCDLHPLDASVEEDRLRLQSFVWPDQTERLARLRGAFDVAQRVPVTIDRESFETWIPRHAIASPECVTVVAHTIVEEHFSEETRQRLSDAIANQARHAKPNAPFARVRMELEGGSYRTSVQIWDGQTEEPEELTICQSDGHAQDIAWQ